MSALLPLRSYQRAALDAVTTYLAHVNRPAIVLPTGGGKTVCFAHLASEHLAEHPGTRVLVLVHTDELVRQAHNKIKTIAPHLVVGIVKAKQDETRADVIVASVQTLRSRKRRAAIQRVSLVIVDECHHATAATYRAILEHYGCMERSVPAVGFTATLERGDGGSLGQVWQDVAFQRDISWMVRKRFLIPPRGKRVEVPELDLSKVKKSGGDFREGDLGEALVGSLAPEIIAKAFLEHAHDRKALAFFPTVASACVAAEAFADQGVEAKVIHGGLPREERRAILAWHRRGTVLINCMILTEGYDDPEVDCIIMARPTQSRPLYIQIVGRGLRVDPARPYEDQDCLLMDVVGVSSRLSLRSMADLSDKPVKEPRDGMTLLDLEDEFDNGEGAPEPDEMPHYAGPVETREFDPLTSKSSRAWLKTSGGAYFLAAGKHGYVFLVNLPDGCDCPGDCIPGAARAPHEPCANGHHRTAKVPGSLGYYCGTCDGGKRLSSRSGWAVAWCTTSHRTPWTCPSSVHDDECTPRHGKVGALTEHRGMDLEMAMTWGEDLAVDMGADAGETLTRRAAPWRRRPASEAAKGMARGMGVKFPDAIKAGELSDRISKVRASQRIDPVSNALVKQAQRMTGAAA